MNTNNNKVGMINAIIKAARVFKRNVPTYTVDAGVEKYGTVFHARLKQFERAKYANGWNHTDDGWVWFEFVGCSGYQHVKVGALERIAVSLMVAGIIFFGKNCVFCDPYWDYNDDDREIINTALKTGHYEIDDTSVRNARLVRENRFKFLVKLVSAHLS